MTKRPPIALTPSIPLETQRAIRMVAGYAFDAQDTANRAASALPGKVSKTKEDLMQVAQFVSGQVQANGAYPINLTSLPGNPQALSAQGPGAGTYTVGAKLTNSGHPGTITIDEYGRITAITQAT